MTGVFIPNDPDGAFQAIHVPDYGITWAGANPFGEGFCFGSESGHLLFADTRGRLRHMFPNASSTQEAINGVAYSQKWLAVTTRRSIDFIPALTRPGPNPNRPVFIAGGATDIAVAPSGLFVIPLGKTGIMFSKPGMTDEDPVSISNAETYRMNFCRVIALPGEEGSDLIVAAGRRGGIGFTSFREGIRSHVLMTVRFDDIDIVDVCSIRTVECPRAVAAAGKDGSLILFRDILKDRTPITFKFNRINGAVYRIMASGSEMFLLTSRGLFGIFNLADRFLRQQKHHGVTTNVLRLAIEAADANLVDDRWLMAVGADDIIRLDISKVPNEPPAGGEASWGEQSPPVELELAPQWEESGFNQMEMALG